MKDLSLAKKGRGWESTKPTIEVKENENQAMSSVLTKQKLTGDKKDETREM